MNREAAVLGTPVWSIFEGRLGAIDELLASAGAAPVPGAIRRELEIKKKPSGAAARRIRRNPADLLDLAVDLPD